MHSKNSRENSFNVLERLSSSHSVSVNRNYGVFKTVAIQLNSLLIVKVANELA